MKIEVLSTTDQDFRDKFQGRVFDANLADGLQEICTLHKGAEYCFNAVSVVREDGQALDLGAIALGDVLIFSSPTFIVRSRVVML